MAGGVRVGIAPDDPTLEPDPTWNYLTDDDSLVASFSIDRGRQFELDRTDTGTATVQVNDRHGVLDPTNTTGPYFGKLEPLLQIQLEILNPVTDTYSVVYRGFIEDFNYTIESSVHRNSLGESVGVQFLTIECVDAFEILSAIEMQPGAFGVSPPLGAEGQVYYDSVDVDVRMLEVLADAGWPTALSTIFTGNVVEQPTTYSPEDTTLNALQEAADSEFPGVANLYVSRTGQVTFHGRLARFDPVGVSAGAGAAWPWTHWKCGDETAVNASLADTAQIRAFAWNRGLSKIINSASATPRGIDEADIAGQLSQDATSIGLRGIRSWSAPDLITGGGKTDGLSANDETKLFSDYYKDNFAEPRNRISELTFRSMRPDDPRGTANWLLLCGAEISDLIDVTVTAPGGGGFDAEPFFVEGVHYDVQPLNGDYADVTLSLDVSPQAYFDTNPFS